MYNAMSVLIQSALTRLFVKLQVGFHSWEEIGVPGEGVGGFANRSVHVYDK